MVGGHWHQGGAGKQTFPATKLAHEAPPEVGFEGRIGVCQMKKGRCWKGEERRGQNICLFHLPHHSLGHPSPALILDASLTPSGTSESQLGRAPSPNKSRALFLFPKSEPLPLPIFPSCPKEGPKPELRSGHTPASMPLTPMNFHSFSPCPLLITSVTHPQVFPSP